LATRLAKRRNQSQRSDCEIIHDQKPAETTKTRQQKTPRTRTILLYRIFVRWRFLRETHYIWPFSMKTEGVRRGDL
jgi:hypothetical protein